MMAIAAGIMLLYVDYDAEQLSLYAVAIAITTYAVIQAFRFSGLYTFERIVRPASQILRIAGVATAVFLLVLAAAFLLKISESYSRVWAISWLVTSIMAIVTVRFVFASLTRSAARKGLLKRRIAIYGVSQVGRNFVEKLSSSAEPWNECVGVFDDRKSERLDENTARPPDSAAAGTLDELVEAARSQRIDEIFVLTPFKGSNARIDHIMAKLSVLPARINLQVCDGLAKYLRNDVKRQHGISSIRVFDQPIVGWMGLTKRTFDLAVSLLVLLVALPIFLVIAIAVKLDSPGPIFFRQYRYGFNNRLIPVWKFRTMYQDNADKNAEKLTTVNDPRVTRVGRILRKTSLDELPQLFNVINGNMSLVGPRPHATRAKAGGRLYQDVIEGYASRHRVKPGITGWAQVNGWRGETDTDEKIIKRVEHDLHYISCWSIALDIKIILKTMQIIFRDENAY